MALEHTDRLERLLTELIADSGLRREFKRHPERVLRRFDLEDLEIPERPVERLQPLDKRLSPSGLAGVVVSMAAEGLALGDQIQRGELDLEPDDARVVARAETRAHQRITAAIELRSPTGAGADGEEPPPEPVARRNPATGTEPARARPEAREEPEPEPETEPEADTPSVPYQREIEAAARRYKLDPALLMGLIKQESNFDPSARSPAGAVGLCQLMKGTAEALGVEDRTDPTQSINGGAKYLREMLDMFDGDERVALAAYNAGPGAVSQHGGVPPYEETQDYVRKVLANARAFRESDSGSPQEPQSGHGATRSPSRSGSLPRTGVLYVGEDRNAKPAESDRRPARGEGGGGPASDPETGTVEALKAEAERIDDARVPYEWGGGHAAKQEHGSPVTPLDCSGAVSRVLGLDPRVSGAFESWGEPGPGKRVTIYANDVHVLMEIDGHFFGTSGSNPGDGAGWIPRAQVTASYLSRFTARHPPGM